MMQCVPSCWDDPVVWGICLLNSSVTGPNAFLIEGGQLVLFCVVMFSIMVCSNSDM